MGDFIHQKQNCSGSDGGNAQKDKSCKQKGQMVKGQVPGLNPNNALTLEQAIVSYPSENRVSTNVEPQLQCNEDLNMVPIFDATSITW